MRDFFSKKRLLILSSILLLVSVTLPILDLVKNFLNRNYLQKDVNKYQHFSSIWCTLHSKEQKFCKLKDVCYDAEFKSILFSLTNDSVISGLYSYTDFQSLQLSTINSHNQFFANISLIDQMKVKKNKIRKTIDNAFLFARFKPDNIMHLIHDDLLPLFFTLEHLCMGDFLSCFNRYTLVIHDNHNEGPYFEMYKLLSNKSPTILNKLPPNILLCFKELVLGLNQDSIFYQYGFQMPHGPINNTKLTQNDLIRFTNFIKAKLQLFENSDNETENIVLISRKKSRRIVNENEILRTLQNTKVNRKNKVIVLDLSQSKISFFIKTLSHATLLVGMHGAEMILSIFMKSNSSIVELFPFGIQSCFVSFVKPLTELKGNSYSYISWTNNNRNYSVPHPDAHPLLGGINHLNKDDQEKIQKLKQVPAVKCCDDPAYLYYMFQDTYVPLQQFSDLLNQVLKPKENWSYDILNDWFWPNHVINLTCTYNLVERNLSIQWLPPFNVNGDVKYSLYILGLGVNFQKEIITKRNALYFKVPVTHEIDKNFKFNLWISSIYVKNNARSTDLFKVCL